MFKFIMALVATTFFYADGKWMAYANEHKPILTYNDFIDHANPTKKNTDGIRIKRRPCDAKCIEKLTDGLLWDAKVVHNQNKAK